MSINARLTDFNCTFICDIRSIGGSNVIRMLFKFCMYNNVRFKKLTKQFGKHVIFFFIIIIGYSFQQTLLHCVIIFLRPAIFIFYCYVHLQYMTVFVIRYGLQ